MTRTGLNALLVPGFHRLFEGEHPPIWTTEMPAVNGVFSARAWRGCTARWPTAAPTTGIGSCRRRRRMRSAACRCARATRCWGLRMRWRLGYHQAFGAGRDAPKAFGHYGYGGSGAWADPDLGLSLGFVTNRIGSVTTPLGDLNLFRLSGVVRRCAVAPPPPAADRAAARAPLVRCRGAAWWLAALAVLAVGGVAVALLVSGSDDAAPAAGRPTS